MITVKVTPKEFGWTVKELKKRGFAFNAAAKTWTGAGDINDTGFTGFGRLIEMGFVVLCDDTTSANDPAVVWMGNRSIEAYGSNF